MTWPPTSQRPHLDGSRVWSVRRSPPEPPPSRSDDGAMRSPWFDGTMEGDAVHGPLLPLVRRRPGDPRLRSRAGARGRLGAHPRSRRQAGAEERPSRPRSVGGSRPSSPPAGPGRRAGAGPRASRAAGAPSAAGAAPATACTWAPKRRPWPRSTRIVAALVEWRGFLEELAAVFAELHVTHTEPAIEDRVESAAAHLLPIVVQRTHAEDAWYSTFRRVLGWYLESAGHDPEVFDEAVATVISGRFESWVTPSTDTASTACAELGYEVALAVADPPRPRDALAAWQSHRVRLLEESPSPRDREPVRGDAHRRYIDGPERDRDPERAARNGRGARGVPGLGSPRRAAHLRAARGVAGHRPRRARGVPHRRRLRQGWAGALWLLPGDAPALRRRLERSQRRGHEHLRAGGARVPRRPASSTRSTTATPALPAWRRTTCSHRAGFALHAVEPLFVLARSANRNQGSLAWLVEYLLGPRPA